VHSAHFYILAPQLEVANSVVWWFYCTVSGGEKKRTSLKTQERLPPQPQRPAAQAQQGPPAGRPSTQHADAGGAAPSSTAMRAARLYVLAYASLPSPAVSAAPSFPLYTLGPNSTAWLRHLPPSPSRRSISRSVSTTLTAYSGDIRARLVVAPADSPGPRGVVTAQIWWRRRDPRPENKSVVVTDAAGTIIPSTPHLVEAACGVISFSPPHAGVYFAYYLPYRRGGGGAHLQFQWYGCDAQTPDCVLSSSSGAGPHGAAPATCAHVMPTAGVTVSGLENRPNAVAEKDHAVDGTAFNGFTHMELTALPSELATLPTGRLNLFLEPRENMVRMFHAPPAHWARGGEVLAANLSAREAEFFTFQVGLYANGAPAPGVFVVFHGATLVPSAGADPSSALPTIDPAAFTCLNLGGTDQHGHAFKKDFSLGAGDTGSLWVGVALPEGAVGKYEAVLSVGTTNSSTISRAPPRTLKVQLDVASGAVAEHGDADVYSLSRLRWLDSTIGVDGEAVSECKL
jgi:hypothetical protein